MTSPTEPFHFKRWARLAKNNPAQFEAMRSALIEHTICQAPAAHQHRLRQLQWQIDGMRRKSPSPIKACIALQQMMLDSLSKQQALFQAIVDICHNKPRLKITQCQSNNNILAFTKIPRARQKNPPH